MAQLVKTNLAQFNSDLLDNQLKTALTNTVCFGVQSDITGIYVILADNATQQQITQALTIAGAHDHTARTPDQAAEVQGKLDIEDLLNKADNALTQLTAKKATFTTTPNLANAAPLLIEAAEDLIGVIKVLKYIVKRIPQ